LYKNQEKKMSDSRVLILILILLFALLCWFLLSKSSPQPSRKKYETLEQQLSDFSMLASEGSSVKPVTAKEDPFLDSSQIPLLGEPYVGTVKVVDVRNFPILKGVTAYLLEIWQEHMRIIHFHDCAEVGVVVEGVIQVYIAAPFPDRLTGSKGEPEGETAEKEPHMEIFTVGPGQCYFIPSGRLHSLSQIGEKPAVLAVGFADSIVLDSDLPVALGAVPAYVKKNYVGSPHDALINYKGLQTNPLFSWNPVPHAVKESPQGHLFRFDLMENPLSYTPGQGMFNWAVNTNWPILRDMAVGLTILQPGNSTDAMWLPTTDTLFVVVKGVAEFSILTSPPEKEPKVHYKQTKTTYPGDMIFVPRSIMFVFRCVSDSEMQMVSFYNRPDPKKPVTLSSVSLYSSPFRQAALLQYGARRDENPIFVDATPAQKLLRSPFPVLSFN